MMHRQSKSDTVFLALLVGAALALAGCPNGNGQNGDVCEDGFVLDENGDCVPEVITCEVWEADCCERTRNPGDRRGQSDCFNLDDAPHTAVCDRPTDDLGMCIFMCITHDDCASAKFAPLYGDLCGDGECVCDQGRCTPPACSADEDCGGVGRCVGGECTDGVANPDGCVIAPDPVYTREGETVQLRAYATLGGDYVVPAGEFSWSSADDAVATVSAETGLVTGGTTESSTTITASVGSSASCTVDVTNFAGLLPTEGRVVVLDELSRQPVVGATVVIDDGVLPDDVQTDGAGVATFATVDGTALDIHVFSDADAEAPNGRAYVSIVGTTENDVIVYLPRNPTEAVGGFQGTMRQEDFAHISADTVHVALAGLSIPGNFIDIDLEILIGELIDTHVEFGSLVDDEIPLPSGLVLGIGEQFFKDWYAPLGVPGKRTGWILGGNLSIPDVTQVLGPVIGGGGDDIAIGPLVGALLPLFESFYSGVQPGLDVTEGDRPETWPPTGGAFPTVNLSLDKPLALKGIVDVPTLPQLGDNFVDGAIVLGGVMVAGQGLVPLGLTAGVDVEDPDLDTPDGQVNSHGSETDPAVGPGQLGLRIAPQHGGVEGSEYVVLSLALGFSDLMDDGGRNPLSGYVTTFDRLQFEETIDFGAASYMGFAEDATWNAGTRTFTPASVTGADVYRASMTGPGGRAWVVYHGGNGAIALVDPDDFGFEDRTTGTINAQAIRTRGSLGLNDVFGFNGTNLDALVDFLHGFSTIAALDDE